jgi:hypothetical protein
LYFQHCEHEKDVYKYQSKQFDILIPDEATHFSWFQIEYLLTRNRASCDSILKPFAVLMSNPGNIGHAYFMQIFGLDNMERWMSDEVITPLHIQNPSNKYMDTYFIPAFISDNKIGVERDPEYEERLERSNPALAAALITGDWTVFAGQAFPQWDQDRHVRHGRNGERLTGAVHHRSAVCGSRGT